MVLCTGNVCRSPYAEKRLTHGGMGIQTLAVVSAGLMAPNRLPPEEAQRVAKERGIDLSGHRSQTFTLAQAEWADLVLVMEVDQRRAVVRDFGVPSAKVILLADLDPEPVNQRRIPDPLGEPLEVFQESYDQVDRCLGEFLATIPK